MVADKRRSRDGRFIERLGYYNPIAAGKEVRLNLDIERTTQWIKNGAQASERVQYLIKNHQEMSKNPEKTAEKA